MAKVLSGWKARRYATALLQAAVKAGELDRVEAEIQALAGMLDRSPQVVKFLAQPLVSFEEKARKLREWLEGRVSPVTLNFLLAIIKHKRVEAFGHIVKTFSDLVREYRGEVIAEVTSAVPLTDEERNAISERLREITGKKVILSDKVDPSIIGGLRIVIRDKLLDLSLKGYLERIREHLRQAFIAIPAEAPSGEIAEGPND